MIMFKEMSRNKKMLNSLDSVVVYMVELALLVTLS